MSPNRLTQVVIAPVISEKRTLVDEKQNQVVFRVMQDATKAAVKAAVESLFKVTVEAVNMVNIAGKQKRFGRGLGRRRSIRKAYVSLAAGQEINFAETK